MPSDLILVVDDDSSVRRVMQMQLAEAGYRVELASAGAEAHRLWIEHRPKLVITDLCMPDLDGNELLHRRIFIGAGFGGIYRLMGYCRDEWRRADFIYASCEWTGSRNIRPLWKARKCVFGL